VIGAVVPASGSGRGEAGAVGPVRPSYSPTLTRLIGPSLASTPICFVETHYSEESLILERFIVFLFFGWLAVMAAGIVIALLPVLAFVAGFVGVLLIFALLGRFVASLFS
jgi:hypothetical protein